MLLIALIFLAFALIHSMTVTFWFKRFCERLLGPVFMRVWYRFLYNLVSVVTFAIALKLMRQVPDQHLLDRSSAVALGHACGAGSGGTVWRHGVPVP